MPSPNSPHTAERASGLVAMKINDGRNPYAVVDRNGPFGDEIVAGYIGTEWEAQLFAAAPELLEALKETLAVATRNEEGDFADRARAAIARTTGEN